MTPDRRKRTGGALRKADVDHAAEVLEGLLAAVHRGELTAPALTVARLEGALIALKCLATGREYRFDDFASD